MAAYYIGTSGWSYDHWVGPFYPKALPAEERLAYYARHLHSTEINNSFYRLPSEAVLADWLERVPDGFVFAAKASRYITHMKKLKDPEDTLPPLLTRIGRLGDKLGPLLFQLPPNWHRNTERLARFLDKLEPGHRYSIELRDQSWLDDEILRVLADAGAAFCIYELDGFRSPLEVTADFAYVRLHGPDGPYRGDYDEAALDTWAERIAEWVGRGIDVYCYFDNDEAGYAVRDARALSARLDARQDRRLDARPKPGSAAG
jgi:uncharacterized protein YecE (DUF72 family)